MEDNILTYAYVITDKDGIQTPINRISDRELGKLTFKVKSWLSKSMYLMFHVIDETKRRGLEHPKLFAEGKAEAIIMSSFVRAWSKYNGKDLKKMEKEKREEE